MNRDWLRIAAHNMVANTAITTKRPTKEGYRKFLEGYTRQGGLLDSDRAYMLAITGDQNYKLRRDIFPGVSVNDLPEN